jgi:hypothetical protein
LQDGWITTNPHEYGAPLKGIIENPDAIHIEISNIIGTIALIAIKSEI